MKFTQLMIIPLMLALSAMGQGLAPSNPIIAPPTSGQLPTTVTLTPINTPAFFTSTGVRYNYYDGILTETTNFGVHVAGATTLNGVSLPNGFWVVTSIDATPRSQASSAALRVGASYFLAREGNVTFFAHAEGGAQSTGATTSPTAAVTGASLLGQLGGGLGMVVNVCRVFNPATKLNCTATLDYSLLSVSSQNVKPILGLFFGTTF